jgi:hypothetical protein
MQHMALRYQNLTEYAYCFHSHIHLSFLIVLSATRGLCQQQHLVFGGLDVEALGFTDLTQFLFAKINNFTD